MKLKYQYIVVVAILTLISGCSSKSDKNTYPVEKDNYELTIAFGSCAHSYDTLHIFDAVNAATPDVWIWLGDIMYGDSHDMDVLKKKYDLQKEKPQYQKLIKSSYTIGIWDDHDYGVNDGGKYYPMKDQSKELLLDFLDVDSGDSVRFRDGVYSDYDFKLLDKLVKVILLDTRYFRDTLEVDTTSTDRYKPNPDGDVLGEEQWQWLERKLVSTTADLIIIGTGIQLIAEEQGFEKWANFPKARKRMFNLLQSVKPAPTLFISGDRHMAELSKIELPELVYPLYDFTSSGLTHTWGMYRPEINKYRVDSLIVAKNFGIIRIDLKNDQPEILLEVRGEDNRVIQQNRIEY